MEAVHLKLPPNAKFHLGEYTEDKATVLYNTSQIIHSDVLFGAFISALSQVSLEKVEVFKEYFESGKLAFSSAFYVLSSLPLQVATAYCMDFILCYITALLPLRIFQEKYLFPLS